MNQFVTFRDTDKEGELQYYILQREHPHFVGLISKIPIHTFVPPSVVAGYNLWICFNGVLAGNYMPSYKNVDEEIVEVLEQMAIYFLENRILTDEKKYKKFKINVTDTTK